MDGGRSAALALAFRAALSALSGPGRAQTMPPLRGADAPPLSPAAASLLVVLSDADAPWWLGPSLRDGDAARRLAFQTGAASAPSPAQAAFLVGAWADLAEPAASSAQIGDPEYPDRGATLIVEAAALPEAGASGAATARLAGPGLQAPRIAAVDLGSIEAGRDFWRWMAANTARFPLGLDVFVCAGDRILGLPRSLKVEPL